MKGKLGLSMTLLVVVGLVVSALLPISWEFLSPNLDPYLHALGALSLTVLLTQLLRKQGEEFTAVLFKIIAAAILASVFWGVVELLQVYIPHHGPEATDLKADMVGVALAGLTLICWELHLHLKLAVDIVD